jgi:hypothetical protein
VPSMYPHTGRLRPFSLNLNYTPFRLELAHEQSYIDDNFYDPFYTECTV